MRNHKNSNKVLPEFSRLFDVTRLAPGGEEVDVNLEASKTECAALAARFGILDIKTLNAVVRLRRMKGKKMRLRVTGHMQASVIQACVVSLVPVPEMVDERFTIVFTDEILQTDTGLDVEDNQEPADFTGGKIDLGEMLAQQLSLSLSPYPRSPDATLNG